MDDAHRRAVAIPLAVGIPQRLQRLVRDVVRDPRGQRPHRHVVVPGHQANQVAPDDVLLGHEVVGPHATEVEDRNDVRMHQARLHPRLVDELTDGLFLARELRLQPLQHEDAREALHAVRRRGEDLGHAALAQPIEQLIPAEDLPRLTVPRHRRPVRRRRMARRAHRSRRDHHAETRRRGRDRASRRLRQGIAGHAGRHSR